MADLRYPLGRRPPAAKPHTAQGGGGDPAGRRAGGVAGRCDRGPRCLGPVVCAGGRPPVGLSAAGAAVPADRQPRAAARGPERRGGIRLGRLGRSEDHHPLGRGRGPRPGPGPGWPRRLGDAAWAARNAALGAPMDPIWAATDAAESAARARPGRSGPSTERHRNARASDPSAPSAAAARPARGLLAADRRRPGHQPDRIRSGALGCAAGATPWLSRTRPGREGLRGSPARTAPWGRELRPVWFQGAGDRGVEGSPSLRLPMLASGISLRGEVPWTTPRPRRWSSRSRA